MLLRKLLCAAMMGRRFGRGSGFGPFGPPPWREGQEGRARRGDVKYLILELLAERPRHGYDIMKGLEEKHGGMYRPSPGSVYPTLQMLEEGGYLTGEQVSGKKVYTITEEGRKLLEQKPPGESFCGEEHEHVLAARESAMKLAAAVMQAIRSGDPALTGKVKAILDRSRREIYSLLADEGEAE
ncbi:MAG: PadR family transcriptional regulator [Candidatus Xenobia bacterium]